MIHCNISKRYEKKKNEASLYYLISLSNLLLDLITTRLFLPQISVNTLLPRCSWSTWFDWFAHRKMDPYELLKSHLPSNKTEGIGAALLYLFFNCWSCEVVHFVSNFEHTCIYFMGMAICIFFNFAVSLQPSIHANGINYHTYAINFHVMSSKMKIFFSKFRASFHLSSQYHVVGAEILLQIQLAPIYSPHLVPSTCPFTLSSHLCL